MGTYSFGYHYDCPKRGKGYTLEWDNGIICYIVKKDAERIKRDLIRRGYKKEEIDLFKNA